MSNNLLNLIEIEADIAGSKRGSALGIQAMREVAFGKKNPLYEKFKSPLKIKLKLENVGQTMHAYAKYIEVLLPFYKKNIALIGGEFINYKSSVVLSGDHANAMSIIAALKKTYPSKKIGIVWIDAHADLHNPYTSPSGNLHGMSLGLYLNDKDALTKNKIPENTKNIWKELSDFTHSENAILPENLVYIGLRSIEQEEEKCISEKKITNYTVAQIRRMSLENMCQNIKTQLQNCDMVYISFDVDALDPSISKGTGTPVKNGFTLAEIKSMLTILIKYLPVKVFEITEINPLLDSENKMAKAAFNILEKMVLLIDKKNHG